MRTPPTDDPEFEQVRSLLRAQYSELGPKQPGWIARLAQRLQPEQTEAEPEWVAHAVPELESRSEPAPLLVRRPPPAETPAPGAFAETAAPEVWTSVDELPAVVARLKSLAAELGELAELEFSELLKAA